MTDHDETLESLPTESQFSRGRWIPLRETIFGLALSFNTWGMWMFNHDLPTILHITAVLALGMSAGIFAAWGCVLAVLLKPNRGTMVRNVVAGVLAAELTSLFLGLLMIRGGDAPHGLLLPLSVFAGVGVALIRRRSDKPSNVAQ